MDELPSNAKDVLRLARDAHDCQDLGARQRVRAAIEGRVNASDLDSPGERSASAEGARAVAVKGASAKLMLALTVSAVIGGGSALYVGIERSAAPAPPSVPPSAAAVEERPAPEASAHASARSEPSAAVTEPRGRAEVLPRGSEAPGPATRGHAARDSLPHELASLEQVDRALANGDVERAAALLARHRARFERPVLEEERDGYQAIAHCLAATRRAAAQARTFLARHPHAVLAERVRRACAIER